MRRKLILGIAFLLAGSTAADRVVLDNGQSFEGVIADRQGDQVVIRLVSGSISLPADRVASLEKADSLLAQYREVEATLLQKPGTAEDWTELAEWCLVRDFEPGLERAALRAATLDPEHDRLPALLRPRGYRLDEEALEWVSEDELRRRRGFVRYEGEWLERAEVRRREAEAEARLAQIRQRIEAARRERSAPTASSPPTQQGHAPIPLATVAYAAPSVVVLPYPIYYHAPRGVRPPFVQPQPETGPASHRAPRSSTYSDLARHQPGSTLPLSATSRH